VGDRWRDVEAGHRAGCQTIFVDYGYRERQPDGPFLRVRSLLEAANWIMRTVRMGVLQYG
jgi:D-glycero-D-manno-heptose 1,7-bisphosphate phosphatase